MRKVLAALIAVFLLFGVVPPTLAAPAGDGPQQVLSFGYDQQRHRIGQSFSWDFPKHQDSTAGISYSQPLMLDGPDNSTRVVLMSGNNLNCYVIPDSGPVEKGWQDAINGWTNPINKEKGASRSHTTYDPEGNLLVTGTVHGWLVYNDPETGIRPFPPTYLGDPDGVVSAPLVMHWQGERIVVAGSKNGNVYMVTNFRAKEIPSPFRIQIGGVLTSSPGPLPNGEGFIIGSDGANKVSIVRFGDVFEKGPDGKLRLRAKPNKKDWNNNGRMSGVPASFAMEGDYAYFSDKRGTFYKFDTRAMKYAWINNDIRSEATFINRSPALDSKYVYFSVQQNAKAGGNGSIVVVDKQTGKIAQTLTADGARIATAPVVTPYRLFAGSEDGRLLRWNKATWEPVGNEQVGSGVKHGSGAILRGLASEISIARGLLVYNVEPGVTHFRQTADTNLYVKDLKPGTDNPEPGQTYTGTVTFGMQENHVPDALARPEFGGITAAVDLTVGGKPVALLDEQGLAVEALPLVKSREEVTLKFTWQAEAKQTDIVARINPEHNAYVTMLMDQGPIDERLYGDNEVRVTLKPVLPDLYAKTLDPGTTKTESGKAYTGKVTFGLKNTFMAPVQAKLTLTHNGYPVSGVNGKVVTFQPGQEQSFPFTYHGAGKESTLYAKIEPVGADDAYWNDNEKTVTVKPNNIDLAIKIIREPSALHKGEKATYVAEITSTAATPITTTAYWHSPGPLPSKRQTITVPAGGKVNVSWTFTMYDTEYGVTVPVFAEVNPNRNQPPSEITWANNKDLSQVKYVTKDPAPPKDPKTGPSHLIPGDWYELP